VDGGFYGLMVCNLCHFLSRLFDPIAFLPELQLFVTSVFSTHQFRNFNPKRIEEIY